MKVIWYFKNVGYKKFDTVPYMSKCISMTRKIIKFNFCPQCNGFAAVKKARQWEEFETFCLQNRCHVGSRTVWYLVELIELPLALCMSK